MLTRIKMVARSRDALDGVVMAGATLIAGVFDYLVLVLAGILLAPAVSIAFLAVMNLLKVLEQVTWVIRNVVAYYTAELAIQPDSAAQLAAFLRRRWRWSWTWGLAAAVLFALLIPFISRLINVESVPALLAAALALLLLFVRPVTDGALQGLQRFWRLGGVQLTQAVLRFGLTVGLIVAGLSLAGAVLALPLASGAALALGVWWLRPYFRDRTTSDGQKVSVRYSMLTLLGLLAFALLVYGDAILVNRLFAADVAAQYTPVNVLARMNLFVPVAIGMVLFPKATQRHALGRDARPYLLLALAATLLPGLGLTAVYFAAPDFIVALVFRGDYSDPGLLLGWVGLATTLYAGVNIWLNYALSLEERPYIILLAVTVTAQIGAILLFHSSLLQMAGIMVAAGLAGNLGGAALLLRSRISGTS